MSPSSLCHINELLSTACDGEERRHSPGEKGCCLKCPHLCKASGMHGGRSELHFMVWYQDGSGSARPLLERRGCLFILVGTKPGFPADLEGILTVTKPSGMNLDNAASTHCEPALKG